MSKSKRARAYGTCYWTLKALLHLHCGKQATLSTPRVNLVPLTSKYIISYYVYIFVFLFFFFFFRCVTNFSFETLCTIAIHSLHGQQCFLPQFSPLNKKFQRYSLFEIICARRCAHFCSTALHTNVHYMTMNTKITLIFGTVVPDSPRYNICLFPACQCSLASWRKWFWILNRQTSKYFKDGNLWSL